jgi:hypothetical protein
MTISIANWELDYLDLLVREHERGIADNRERLKWLIHMIENNYDLSSRSPGRLAHISRIRRMLDDTPNGDGALPNKHSK